MSRRRSISIILLALVAIAILVAFIPLPAPLIRVAAIESAPWLVAPDSADGRFVRASKRIWRGYLQSSIAAYLAADVDDDSAGNDVFLLAGLIDRTRGLVVTTPEKLNRFDPAEMPAIISGVGYCDQINGVVAAAAAHHFKRAELFALFDGAARITPHTIGRVWSTRRHEWLYFDAFFEEPVIFRRGPEGDITFLWTRDPRWKIRTPAPARIYQLPGWTLTRFSSSFPGYLMERILPSRFAPAVEEVRRQLPARWTGSSARGASSSSRFPLELSTRPELSPEATMRSPLRSVRLRNDEVYGRVAHEFVRARVQHLTGRPNVNSYRLVARDPSARQDDRAAELALVAGRFASLLQTPRR
jgi:hypothetical protein